MTMQTAAKQQEYQDITQILHGKPATSVATLPMIWQNIAANTAAHQLSDVARKDYVEAAQLFNYHKTPMSLESMTAIGQNFTTEQYPNFDHLLELTNNDISRKTALVLQDLFNEFGYDLPAAFYTAIIDIAAQDVWRDLFKNKNNLIQDRLWDAVIHATLLVTPVGLYIQSVFSKHGLRFTHMMNCSCKITETIDEPFQVTFDRDLKPAYLQNVIAAAFEQYGVNAATSGAARGF